ncbi:MAG TPA: DUF4230 domain-containing protein [Chthoniobacterales bacterium]
MARNVQWTRGGASRFVLTLTACGAILLLIGALTARYVLIDLPSEVAGRMTDSAVRTARDVAGQISSALQVQPKMVVASRTVVAQKSEVLRLVTLEQSITQRETLSESWLHSTKQLEVEGDFVIRVGFDLEKPFVIEVDQASGALRVKLPPAEILSTELHDVRFLKDEDGLWNHLTDSDREQAVRDLRLRVALEARQSDLRERAVTVAQERISHLLASSGHEVTFLHAATDGAPNAEHQRE